MGGNFSANITNSIYKEAYQTTNDIVHNVYATSKTRNNTSVLVVVENSGDITGNVDISGRCSMLARAVTSLSDDTAIDLAKKVTSNVIKKVKEHIKQKNDKQLWDQPGVNFSASVNNTVSVLQEKMTNKIASTIRSRSEAKQYASGIVYIKNTGTMNNLNITFNHYLDGKCKAVADTVLDVLATDDTSRRLQDDYDYTIDQSQTGMMSELFKTLMVIAIVGAICGCIIAVVVAVTGSQARKHDACFGLSGEERMVCMREVTIREQARAYKEDLALPSATNPEHVPDRATKM